MTFKIPDCPKCLNFGYVRIANFKSLPSPRLISSTSFDPSETFETKTIDCNCQYGQGRQIAQDRARHQEIQCIPANDSSPVARVGQAATAQGRDRFKSYRAESHGCTATHRSNRLRGEMKQHVIPLNDLIEHIADESCECNPLPDVEEPNVIVHRALDDRALRERIAGISSEELNA